MSVVNLRDELHSLLPGELREYTKSYLGNRLFLYRSSDNIYVYTSNPSSSKPYTVYDLQGSIVRNDNEISRELLNTNATLVKSYYTSQPLLNSPSDIRSDRLSDLMTVGLSDCPSDIRSLTRSDINLLIPDLSGDTTTYFFVPTLEVDSLILQFFRSLYPDSLDIAIPILYRCVGGRRKTTGFDHFVGTLKHTSKPFVATTIQLNNPLSCNKRSWGLHVNILFADTRDKQIIRFEPRGWSSEYDSTLLDAYIQSYIPSDYTYIPLFQYCPKESFQRLQGSEKLALPTDPEGFCASWSLWFLEYRLSNPSVSTEHLLQYALQDLPRPLTVFVRNYSTWLTQRLFDYLFSINYFDKRPFISLNEFDNISPIQLGVVFMDGDMIPAVIRFNPTTKNVIIVTQKETLRYTYENFPNNLVKIIEPFGVIN